MNQPKYQIHATTERLSGHDVSVFTAIEIIPPIPKALARIACEKIAKFCDDFSSPNTAAEDNINTEITPYGFCDEGATVSTLLKFSVSPTFLGGSKENDLVMALDMQRRVAKIISPSGAAISDPSHRQ